MTEQKKKNLVEEWSRMWASASFVGILIVVGLPLWWKTTEVYRVALPYDKIASFDSLPQKITTELMVVANDEATASQIAALIEKTFEDSDVINLNVTTAVLPNNIRDLLSSSNEQEAETMAGNMDMPGAVPGRPCREYSCLVQRSSLAHQVSLGQEVVFFKDASSGPVLVEVLEKWVYKTSELLGARADTADAARRTRFPPGDNYHITLSVVHPRPDLNAVEFDAKQAVEDYIGSFVDELSVLHNFTLKSQWLFMLDFDFQAKQVIDKSEWGHHFAVSQDRLSPLLTRLEERAATHVSSSPTINLALYSVRCDTAPLATYRRHERIETPIQAFMSPKWGGVVLSNPTPAECRGAPPAHRPDPRVVMGAFIAQLRELLGITDYEVIPGAHLVPLRGVSPRRWEVAHLVRMRTLEQVSLAEHALRSLAQLLGEISNIVINDDVGASINSAVEGIERARRLMAEGRPEEAYHTSQAAHAAAETAFMEPSLLALLYFPDDQKYAIYIPLFLPIMFPVMLSFKNLFLWFRGKPKEHIKQD